MSSHGSDILFFSRRKRSNSPGSLYGVSVVIVYNSTILIIYTVRIIVELCVMCIQRGCVWKTDQHRIHPILVFSKYNKLLIIINPIFLLGVSDVLARHTSPTRSEVDVGHYNIMKLTQPMYSI